MFSALTYFFYHSIYFARLHHVNPLCKHQYAFLQMKEAPNQKVQEKKPLLKFKNTKKYMCLERIWRKKCFWACRHRPLICACNFIFIQWHPISFMPLCRKLGIPAKKRLGNNVGYSNFVVVVIEAVESYKNLPRIWKYFGLCPPSPLPDCEDWCCSAHYSTIHRVRGRGIDSCKFSTFCFLFNFENQTCPDPWSQSLIFDTNLLISRVKEWGIPAFLFWHLIELLIDYRL